MALFQVERASRLAAGEAWRRVTRWERHGDALPLTRVTVTAGSASRHGTAFVARTGAGPLAFDDPMEVVAWEPPTEGRAGRCRLVKRGTVVTGWGEIEVRPEGDGSRVVWREEARVRFVPALLDAPLGAAARLVFGRVLDALLSKP